MIVIRPRLPSNAEKSLLSQFSTKIEEIVHPPPAPLSSSSITRAVDETSSLIFATDATFDELIVGIKVNLSGYAGLVYNLN